MIKRTLLAGFLTLLSGAFFNAHAAIEIQFPYFTDDMTVFVEQEMMTNNVMVSSFSTTISNAALDNALPEADGGKWAWIWLKCDYGKFGARGERSFPEYGTDCEIEITAQYTRPTADAVLLLSAYSRNPDRYDKLVPYVQTDRRVEFYGEVLQNEDDRPTLHTSYLQPERDISGTPTMVPGQIDGSTYWPPAVTAEVRFRGECHAVTDVSPDPAFCQASFAPVGTEGRSVNSESTFFQTPVAKGSIPFQGDIISDSGQWRSMVPPGRDFAYFGGEGADHSSVTLMFGGFRLRSTPDPIAAGGSWATLWQVPIGFYVNPAEFGTPGSGIDPVNPWTFTQDDTCAFDGFTIRQYIPASNLRTIPLTFQSLRLWITAGYVGNEGVSLSKLYIGNADVGALPAFSGSPVQVNIAGDTSPLLVMRESAVSNAVTLARLTNTGLIVSAHFDSAANDCIAVNVEAAYSTGNTTYTKAGVDEAATTGALSGYSSTSNSTALARRIEVLIED